VRRVDLQVEDMDNIPYNPREHLGRNCFEMRACEFHVVPKHDTNEWYSRPGVEEIVDADPIPYVEDGGVWCSVTADALYHNGGFHLNEQRDPTGEPFYIGTDPTDLLVSMLMAKVELYARYADSIKNRDQNIYYNYFSWVAENVTVNPNYTFIPNFMLRPDTKFYKGLSEGGFTGVQQGLLLKDVKSVIPVVEIK